MGKLDEIKHTFPQGLPLPKDVPATSTYRTVQDHIRRNIGIPDNNPLWGDIELLVLDFFPEFKDNLYIISNGRLNATDTVIAMLYKLGLKSSDICILTNRTSGTVSYHKKRLARLLLGEDSDVNMMVILLSLL